MNKQLIVLTCLILMLLFTSCAQKVAVANDEINSELNNDTNNEISSDINNKPTVAPSSEPVVSTTSPTESPTESQDEQEANVQKTSDEGLFAPDLDDLQTISQLLDQENSADFFDDAVFLGDSITVGLETYVKSKRKSDSDFFGSAKFLAKNSYSLRATTFKDGHALHPDYNGNRVQPQKNLKAMRAKKVFIMLGVNDIEDKKDTILSNYKALVSTIQETVPDIEVYIVSIYPMCEEKEDELRNNDKINYINYKLRKYAYKENIPFIDVTSAFMIKKRVDESLYSDKFVHLNSKGYAALSEQIVSMSEFFSLSGGGVGKVVNVESSANGRKDPNNEAEIVSEIPKGSVVFVQQSSQDDWYKVRFKHQEMFVHKSLILYSNKEPIVGIVSDVDEFANLREVPSTGTEEIGSVAKDTRIIILADYYNEHWYRIFYDDQICYIYKPIIK